VIPPSSTHTQTSLRNEAYEYAQTVPAAQGVWCVIERDPDRGTWRVACWTWHQAEAREVYEARFELLRSQRAAIALFCFHPWDGRGFRRRRGVNGALPMLHRFGRGLSA
jgi:hypothetical protein